MAGDWKKVRGLKISMKIAFRIVLLNKEASMNNRMRKMLLWFQGASTIPQWFRAPVHLCARPRLIERPAITHNLMHNLQ